MKPLPVAICNDRRPCRGLKETLMDNGGRGGGLHCKTILTIKTGVQRPLYITRSHANDCGVVLNFCPFCGRAINKRWTRRRKESK